MSSTGSAKWYFAFHKLSGLNTFDIAGRGMSLLPSLDEVIIYTLCRECHARVTELRSPLHHDDTDENFIVICIQG